MADIINQAQGIVLLRLNSGRTRHLAPHEVLKDVEHVEIKGNSQIKRLVEKRLIAIEPPPGRRAEGGVRRRSGEMRAEDAVEHIRTAPVEEIEDFLSPDEQRRTVLRAMEERRAE
jgi:hypothetical protein